LKNEDLQFLTKCLSPLLKKGRHTVILVLVQLLRENGVDRLSRLSMVKKELVRAVEDSILQGATNGRLQGKVYHNMKQ